MKDINGALGKLTLVVFLLALSVFRRSTNPRNRGEIKTEQKITCGVTYTCTQTFTFHGNEFSCSSDQRRGFSCTLSPTGPPSACPGYAPPTDSQICSDGQWNDPSHDLNHHNQELDTSCFRDTTMEVSFKNIFMSLNTYSVLTVTFWYSSSTSLKISSYINKRINTPPYWQLWKHLNIKYSVF